MTLNIADGLALPLDYVTKTAAILAQRRKGKTYTASVIAEELVDAGQPWVALDPTGAWWGLRSSADGERAGLPVVILGGQHGDAPLERASGRFVAELVVESPGWYVLDLSLFESRAAEREFAADFGEALIRRKRQPGRDFPMHLFVDEADMFAPQEKETGDQRMLGAYQAIVRRGGLHGLGSTLISQRPALLNKSVLTQLDLLVLLRLVAGQDQDAVDKNYLNRAGGPEQRAALMESLATLRLGEAWVWEPGAEPPLFERVLIRQRRTFNSSATPKPGELRVEPRRLADVDLDAVKDAMAAAIDRAKADDPRELRRQIADLRRELADRPSATPVVERVEVPFVPPPVVALLEEIDGFIGSMEDIGVVVARLAAKRPEVSEAVDSVGRGTGDAPSVAVRPAPTVPRPTPKVAPAPKAETTGKLGGAASRILSALVVHGPTNRRKLGFLAGVNPSLSTWRGAIASLRGLIDVEGDVYSATEAGCAEMGSDVQALPEGPALLDFWMAELSSMSRTALRAMVDAWPRELERDELAAAMDVDPTLSTFRGALAPLRKLGLVNGFRVSDDLMEAVRS